MQLHSETRIALWCCKQKEQMLQVLLPLDQGLPEQSSRFFSESLVSLNEFLGLFDAERPYKYLIQ